MSDKQNIKLIVIDLDGTLLNSDHKLSDRNKTVIKKAIDSGIKVALATGKTRKSAEGIIAELGINTPGVFVQGLMLYNADGTVKSQTKLDPKVTRKVIQYSEQQGMDVVAYSGDRLLVKANKPSVDKLAEFGEPKPVAVGQLLNTLDNTIIHKLMVIADNERHLKKLQWQLNQQVGQSVSFTTAAMLTSIEVLPKGASKGNGVRALLRLLEVNAENVMAIGDAENDIEMLQLAGLGVAMGNASAKVKEAANQTVASNDDDGVAEAIERFVLPEEKAEEAPATDTTATVKETKTEDTPTETTSEEKTDA